MSVEFITEERALELAKQNSGLFQCHNDVMEKYKYPDYSYVGYRGNTHYIVKHND